MLLHELTQILVSSKQRQALSEHITVICKHYLQKKNNQKQLTNWEQYQTFSITRCFKCSLHKSSTFQLFTFQGWKWHYIKQIDNIGSKLLLTIRRHNHKTAAKTFNNYQNSSDELITVGPYLIHKYDVLLLLTSDKLDKHDYMLSDPMTPLPGLQIYSLVWS